jgi:serine/threonine protein phosphatase PrpC
MGGNYMLCPKCGSSVNTGDNFCEECGASLKQSSGGSSLVFPESDTIVCSSELAVVTNKGRRHPTNEDSGTVVKCTNGDSILIVADGVSSSVNAVSGSQKAIEIIKEALVKSETRDVEAIKYAISLADACVKKLPYEVKEDVIYGPETTVVTAVVQDNKVSLGWVGDSRAYILNENKQEQLTVDDSWVELVVAEGSMTREEAMLDKRAHYVIQVLGMHDAEAEIHVLEGTLNKGELLLLCSDGLWNYFQGEKDLLKAVMNFGINSEAAAICAHLTELANAAGGRDNITAAILKNL